MSWPAVIFRWSCSMSSAVVFWLSPSCSFYISKAFNVACTAVYVLTNYLDSSSESVLFGFLMGLSSSRVHNNRSRYDRYYSTARNIELMVRMDCPGCERSVRKALAKIKGVDSVDINMRQNKVTVLGRVDPNKVLKKIRRTGKRAEFWSHGSHIPTARSAENQTISLFSDENPNNCSIM